MSERPRPSQERVSVLKHPILSGRLAWTEKRISTFEKTRQQAVRIISLLQAPMSAKNEAQLNFNRSAERLFDLRKHREDLLRKSGIQKEKQTEKIPTYRRSFTQGDDVFGGHDL